MNFIIFDRGNEVKEVKLDPIYYDKSLYDIPPDFNDVQKYDQQIRACGSPDG